MEKLNKLTPYERLEVVRHKGRPTIRDYIPLIFDEFWEMHGDRLFGDDGAIMGGIASISGIPVTVIAEVKGRNLNENKDSNFAMPHPEGYRKALRLAKQAEKFHRPVICFIDTPGAFCGVEAEKRGQGEAIAKNLMEFMRLKTPVISIVLGEGGSGGALALGVGDTVVMLENSIYSVISPEGCASILWKDSSKAPEAANALRLTSRDLYGFGVIDKVIDEQDRNAEEICTELKHFILSEIAEKELMTTEELLAQRYEKFRKIGA